jgi:hypothetical protein
MRFTWEAAVLPACDVVVVGGGSAGIAAAVASARNGARTTLVEKYGFLGGTATAGLVGPFMTSYSADGSEQVIGGIFQEVVDRMVAMGGAIDPAETQAGEKWAAYITTGHAHVTPFQPEALKMAAMELVVQAGVRLMLHTAFVDAARQGSGAGLSGIVMLTKAGHEVLPATVVVDCSADGDVAVKAGAPFTVGRDDGKMMPATMFFRIGNVDDAKVEAFAREHQKLHPGERLFECIVREARQRNAFPISREWINIYREPEPGVWRANVSRLHDIDGTNPEDLTRAEVEGRRQVLAIVEFMRAHCPGLERAKLLEMAAQVGIRETRHILGEYVLTGEDVLQGARFPDAIARCAYPIDIHDPQGSRGKLLGLAQSGYYEIPYRCLVPRTVEGLLVAGRCFSATHEGAASARVIPPVFAMGQAAGTAAALCAREGITPRALSGERVRAVLREQGAIV